MATKKCGFFGHCFHELPGRIVSSEHGKFGTITTTQPSFIEECCKCPMQRDMSGGF